METGSTLVDLLLDPERLPVTVLLLAGAAVLVMSARNPPAPPAAPRPWPGPHAADAIAATVVGLGVVVCALVYETPLGAPPGSAPTAATAATAPWFLSGLQTLSHPLGPGLATLALPLLLLAGLLALPWLETAPARPDREPSTGRRLARRLFLLILLAWLLPIVTATYLRAPPAPATPPPAAFSDVFWGLWLKTGVPARWGLRELPGVLLLALYLLLPLGLARWKPTRRAFERYREDLGFLRLCAVAVWILALGIVPLKLLGRWLWGIDVWIDLP